MLLFIAIPVLIPKDKKKEIIHQKGMILVPIPCWWDGAVERYYNSFNLLIFPHSLTAFVLSLVNTISFHCPHLMSPSDNYPISLNPPFNFFECMFIMISIPLVLIFLRVPSSLSFPFFHLFFFLLQCRIFQMLEN